MEYKIDYTKVEDGFLVTVPYDLKDQFKAIFKTAKWQSTKKMWKVGPRSGKRLETFVNGIKNDLQELNDRTKAQEELDVSEKELELVKTSIKEILRETETLEKISERRSFVLAELKKRKPELEQIKEKRDNLLKEADNKLNEIKKIVDEVINVNELLQIASEMNRCHSPGSQNRRNFRRIQKKAEEMQELLYEKGIISEGVNAIALANFNRPDRDLLYKVTAADIYRIRFEEE